MRNILFLSVLLLFNKLVSQEQAIGISSEEGSLSYEFLEMLFSPENLEKDWKSIELPGSYDYLIKDSNKNGGIVFRKLIDVSNPNTTHTLKILKGIDDFCRIYINGNFIKQTSVLNEKIEVKIPDGILKPNNEIIIQVINSQDNGSVNGLIILEPIIGESIDISGLWEYKLIQELWNFEIRSTISLNSPNSYLSDDEESLYAAVDFDDSKWRITNLPIKFEQLFGSDDMDGIVWFRKIILMDTLPETDLYIEIPKGIDDADDFYFNGHRLGQTICYYCPRNYRIPAKLIRSKNVISFSVLDSDGTGGFNTGPIDLVFPYNRIDISKEWTYKALYDLKILTVLRKTSNSFFDTESTQILDSSVNPISDEIFSKFLANKAPPYIYILLISIIIGLLIFVYRLKYGQKTEEFIEAKPALSHSQYLFIRADRINHKVDISHIISVDAKKDYVKVVTKEKSYLVHKNLKTFASDLPENKFIRVSRSIIINVDFISRIDRNIIYLHNNSFFKIGQSFQENIEKMMG